MAVRENLTTKAPERTSPPAKPGPKLADAAGLRKLTALTVYGKLDAMAKGDPTRWLGDWYCYVTGSKQDESQYGVFTRWIGQFRHVWVESGEMVEANQAIFPPIAAEKIEAAFLGGNNLGGAAANIMIAFRLGTDYDLNRAGYRWTVKDIISRSYESPLDVMMNEAYQLALPAPGENGPATEMEREAAE